jgi:hypothetical protein
VRRRAVPPLPVHAGLAGGGTRRCGRRPTLLLVPLLPPPSRVDPRALASRDAAAVVALPRRKEGGKIFAQQGKDVVGCNLVTLPSQRGRRMPKPRGGARSRVRT